MTTETWTKKVLIDRIKDRAARGFEIPPDQMAKAIIFEAELKARGGSSDDGDWEDATLEVKSKKQSKAIAALTEELSKASSKALLSKKPIQLLDALATAAADPNKDAIRVKTAPKRIGSRNLKHVSIDVKKAKNQWLAALATV